VESDEDVETRRGGGAAVRDAAAAGAATLLAEGAGGGGEAPKGTRRAAPCHKMARSSPTGSPASVASSRGVMASVSEVDRGGAGSMSCNKKSKESEWGLEAANGK